MDGAPVEASATDHQRQVKKLHRRAVLAAEELCILLPTCPFGTAPVVHIPMLEETDVQHTYHKRAAMISRNRMWHQCIGVFLNCG